jgi:hypothetical protein
MRKAQKSIKREPLIDFWTLVHVLAGILLVVLSKCFLGITSGFAAVLAFLVLLAWEVVEYARTPEYYKRNLDNNVADAVADLVGIALAWVFG